MKRELPVEVLCSYEHMREELKSLTVPGNMPVQIQSVREVKEFPGQGTRYTCVIAGEDEYLWKKKNGRWFMFYKLGIA